MSTVYDAVPEHPLAGVPPDVLEAARKVTRDAAAWRDIVDPDHAESIADAVLAASLPRIRAWLAFQNLT